MPNGKRVSGAFAASILLAASLAAAPAIAKKPPPPPPVEDPDDPWAGCTPWGSYVYDVDCCGYPELIVPCESPSSDPAIRPEDGSAAASGR